MTKIANLKIANQMFADFLERKKLILPSDNIIEITSSIVDSATIFLNGTNPKNIIMHNANPKDYGVNFNPTQGINNFICNGVYPTTENYTRRMIGSGAFNVGICTSDLKDYKKAKTFYQKFGSGMMLIGAPIDVYEEELSEGKIYLLSYRSKK